MKKFSCKVLPIFRNKNKNCCICLEKKRDCISCTNPKCKDGIICLSCLKKMSHSQKDHCQICRVEMDVFKNDKVQPKSIITNIRDEPVIYNNHQRKCYPNKRKKITCCETVKEGLCIILSLVACIGVTYSVGLITLFWITGKFDTNFNPVLLMLFGVLTILIMFGVIWGCGAIKIYLINRCLSE